MLVGILFALSFLFSQLKIDGAAKSKKKNDKRTSSSLIHIGHNYIHMVAIYNNISFEMDGTNFRTYIETTTNDPNRKRMIVGSKSSETRQIHKKKTNN